MKQIIILLILICSCLQSFSKSDSTHVFFFNAFSVSVNETNVADDITANRYGYGIGIYHIGNHGGNDDRPVSFLLGFEYNRTNQFKEYGPFSHFYDEENVTYSNDAISLATGLRIKIRPGNKYIFLIEPCAYLDVNNVNRTGTLNTYAPNQPYQSGQFTESAGTFGTFGLSLGIGLELPLSKYKLIIMPEYKLVPGSINDDFGFVYDSYYRLLIELKLH